MRSRYFTIFGIIAIVAAAGLFLVLASSTTWPWYWNWLIAAGVVTFVFYAYDKISAKAGGGRIPEILFHLMSLSGGFAGALLGMLTFRHKSNMRAHPFFLPVILIGAALWSVIVYRLLTATG